MKIGIEIELGALVGTTTDKVLRRKGWERTWDSSVRTSYDNVELRSKVYDVKNGVEEEIANDYKEILDTFVTVEVNNSMGIHVHVSDIYYHRLFSREFWNEFKRRFKQLYDDESIPSSERDLVKARFDNRYCRFIYNSTTDSRYRAINYVPAYNQHKTIEFRAFPSTTNINVFKKFLKLVIDLVTEFNRKEKFEVVGKVDTSKDVVKLEDLII